MSIPNYTTSSIKSEVFESKCVKNSHISYPERIRIETLIAENYSTLEISTSLGRPRRTIQNEISNRKTYLLKGRFCKTCKLNRTCTVSKSCDFHEAYGSCNILECSVCPTLTCANFIRGNVCPSSNKCNTCNGCSKYNHCSKSKILYSSVAAKEDYSRKRKSCKGELKINKIHGLIEYIQDRILKKKYSPDAISGRIKHFETSFSDTISTSTIYSAIDKGKIPGVANINLKLKCGLKLKREKQISTGANTHRIGRELDKRIDDEITPTCMGHYELDLIEGIKGGAFLLTFIDRFTSLLYIRKIPDKTQASVHIALNSIEKYICEQFGKNIIKSITTDNGCEFKNFTAIEASCVKDDKRCNLFYTMPYSSWQKGKIEQANWVIRTYIYKGQDINDFSEKQIYNIQKTINNMPRKRLKYFSSLEAAKKAFESVA